MLPGKVTLLACGICMLIVFAGPVFADSVDDLFDVEDDFSDSDTEVAEETEEAEETDEAEEAPAEDGIDLDALGTRETKVTGRVSLEGGVLYGLDDWPNSASAGDKDFDDLRSGSAFYDMKTRFSIDARPQSHLRFFGSMEIELDTDKLVFTPDSLGRSIGELFIDYTLADNYFFRVGKQGLTWGEGRLLGNPGNLVTGIKDGVAVRGFFPVGSSGVTAVMYAAAGDFADKNDPTHREFKYSAEYDISFADYTLGIAGRYRHADELRPLHASTYAKTAVGPVDVALEAVAHFDPRDIHDDNQYWLLGNVFYEFGSPLWRIVAEYQYGETETPKTAGHHSGLAIRAPRVLEWTPALRWKHSWTEDAGEVVLGIDRSLASNLRGSIGIPVTYGEPDSYYRSESDVPGNRVAAVIMRLNVSFEF